MRMWITRHFGILLLLPIIGLVVFSSLNSSQYFAGWDNFSTSLDVSNNLPRTIFATWRAYRGLGSPSDSEVVDVSRQLFYLVFSWLPVQLIDQVYVFFTLAAGVLGVYYLIRLVTQDHNHKSTFSSNIAALTGGLLFLFSLNTIVTYFFPMPMFIARFAYFPWVIYCFINYLQKTSRKKIAAFALVSFAVTSAYLTATVFITLAFILGLISLYHLKQLKNLLVLGVVFLLVNSFWLLPFADYTSRKSNLLPLASVFADVNENQLNEAPYHFDWPYLTSTYPNFLHVDSATDPQSGESISLHSEANKLNPMQAGNWPLMALTIAGLMGSILALFSKKLSFARFIPLLIILSLFMLRKEYPPLGNIYDWLGHNIPYFKIVFRFGDTKFNSLLALFASLGIGVGVYWLLERFKSRAYKIAVSIPIAILTVLAASRFWFITTSELVSKLAQTHIPLAYFEIARTINQDPIEGRVLHLPNDKLSYFKAHSWGYFGSTFMAFLLDKPLLDRAFAPTSPGNDAVDLKLFDLAQNFPNLQTDIAKAERVDQLKRLLAATNTRYIIHDQTIAIENAEDKITLWGQFLQEDFAALITAAAQAKVLTPVKTYTVDAPEPHNTLTLYQVTTPNLPTQVVTQATAISWQQDDTLTLSLAENQTLYQSQTIAGDFYPFHQPSLMFEDETNTLQAKLGLPISSGIIETQLKQQP